MSEKYVEAENSKDKCYNKISEQNQFPKSNHYKKHNSKSMREETHRGII